MNTPRKAAVSFIFFTILIDVIGFGLLIPVMPDFIQQLTGCDNSTASWWGGWLSFAYAATQFLFAPVLGNLSDRYGRRPVLLISMFGFGLDYILQAFAPTIGWLFVGRIIAGITGSSFSTASAYIADVSTPETRAKNFGMIGAAFGMGFIIGPMLGGLLGQVNLRLPFYVSAGLCLLNGLYGYFVLPESLPPERRRKFEWKRANPLGALNFLTRYPSLSGLTVSLMLLYTAAHAVQSNWTFFTKELFQWSKSTIGISLGVVGVLVGLVQAGLTRVLNPKIGNERSIYLGFACYATGMFLFGIASATWMMFVFLIPYCLGGISQPSLQAVIAEQVPPTEQGELQGALMSLISVTSIIGPVLMTNLFSYFTGKQAPFYFPGISFMLGSAMILVSAVLAYRALRVRKAAG
jgi:MFS transporter, DHA1 family, tetracycline resistance protein